ncbi:MAG: AlwI family type II restriction endonuclease [Oscillospiraceae bacterium]|nr:AlwI family type II restriction endonuclease [Oscillospiraceae bacterium]
MLNYWWVTRPKRKLNSIPEVLSTYAEISLNEEWKGQRGSHLSFEDALEEAGLKRKGERRDQTGGGARTYQAWVTSLGLIFTQESTGKTKLTLAGEAIMNGDNPVDVLKNQVLKYQFPSSYSIGVNVAERFKIHPFVFMLRLLADDRIESLSEEEIAKIVITEAENESKKCFESVVSRILEFRENGNKCLEDDFFIKYAPSKGGVKESFSHLMDVANTLVNWLEYTQLARREDGRIAILPDKREEVDRILSNPLAFIDRPQQHEYFQRKYGVDPKHQKDTRNLIESTTVTARIIAEQKVRNAFISISLKQLVSSVNAKLIDEIIEMTGIDERIVEETLLKYYPKGSIGAFMTEYFEMAFKGRDEATEFEKATVNIFQDVFGFTARHVGPIGLTPDVLILSDTDGYSAIIDNKAYSRYTISNDHHNRMVHNYIANIGNYYDGDYPLAFFSYIAGGFGANIDRQLKAIIDETGVAGSAMNVSNMIELIRKYDECGYDHSTIKRIFSVGRQVLLSDLS